MKNKKGQTVTWKLYRLKVTEGQQVYFWVDPENIVKFERGTSCLGWVKPSDDYYGIVGSNLKELKDILPEVKQVNHKMTDEELSKGWLLL